MVKRRHFGDEDKVDEPTRVADARGDSGTISTAGITSTAPGWGSESASVVIRSAEMTTAGILRMLGAGDPPTSLSSGATGRGFVGRFTVSVAGHGVGVSASRDQCWITDDRPAASRSNPKTKGFSCRLKSQFFRKGIEEVKVFMVCLDAGRMAGRRT